MLREFLMLFMPVIGYSVLISLPDINNAAVDGVNRHHRISIIIITAKERKSQISAVAGRGCTSTVEVPHRHQQPAVKRISAP